MAQQQQHHYKLVYFSIRGLGEPIRLLLNYAKIDFEDVRIHLEAWPEIKPSNFKNKKIKQKMHFYVVFLCFFFLM